MKLSYAGTSSLKSLVASTPVLGAAARSLADKPVVKRLRHLWRRCRFPGSSWYWEERYRQGGTSGSGSFGRLAEFKAETLNGYVARMAIQSVIEFGCGDGAQLDLARYPRYVGVDVAESSISACRSLFCTEGCRRQNCEGRDL